MSGDWQEDSGAEVSRIISSWISSWQAEKESVFCKGLQMQKWIAFQFCF